MNIAKIEKLKKRIDSLEYYYAHGYNEKMPSVNVKVYGSIKSIDDISKTLKIKEPFLSEAVKIVKEKDESEYGNYFWNACEVEQNYSKEVIFEGCRNNTPEYWCDTVGLAIEQGINSGYPYIDTLKTKEKKLALLNEWIVKDKKELDFVDTLKQYESKSGFFGKRGGHFCIGISKDDLEEYLFLAEDEKEYAKEHLDTLAQLLDAIEWGLDTVKEIASGVPETIIDMIESDIHERAFELEKEHEERQRPEYKIDTLREWVKTLSPKEKEIVNRSIISIEKMLLKK